MHRFVQQRANERCLDFLSFDTCPTAYDMSRRVMRAMYRRAPTASLYGYVTATFSPSLFGELLATSRIWGSAGMLFGNSFDMLKQWANLSVTWDWSMNILLLGRSRYIFRPMKRVGGTAFILNSLLRWDPRSDSTLVLLLAAIPSSTCTISVVISSGFLWM